MGNDGAFINETMIQYCADHGIEVTRSRAYRSNNRAWIEQKNGSVVRRFVGHDRYSGQVAGQTMAHLYGALRRYVNFFQPSFKLIDKTRDGATTVKHYSQPTTPCDGLIQHDATRDEMKEYRARLDPVLLLHTVRGASQPWWRRLLQKCGKRQRAKASASSSPNFASCGVKARSDLLTRQKYEVRGTGAREKIPSRVFGAPCWCGCKPNQVPPARS